MDIANFCAASSTFNLGDEAFQLRPLTKDEVNELGSNYPNESGKIIGLGLTLAQKPDEFAHQLLGLPFMAAALYQSKLLASAVAVSINAPDRRNEIMALPDLQLLAAFATVLVLTMIDLGAFTPAGTSVSLADLAKLEFLDSLVK